MIHRFLRYYYRTERHDLPALCQLPLHGKTALDIGANKGIFSYWLSQTVGTKGQVIAFEPQPELFQHLKYLQEIFQLSNLTIINQGVSSEVGQALLFRNSVGDGGASITHTENKSEHVSIQLNTLDNFDPKDNSIEFIKVDVEGHEVNVISGGLNLIQFHRPTLMIECSLPDGTDLEIMRMLDPLHYIAFFLDSGKPLKVDQIREVPNLDRNICNRNVWFCPKDKLKDRFPHLSHLLQ